MLSSRSIGVIAATLLGCSIANAQFSELLTDFETNGAGSDFATNVAAQGDLQVVVFQDPREANVTEANILDDSLGTNGLSGLRSTEESLVTDFTVDNFFGANNVSISGDDKYAIIGDREGSSASLIPELAADHALINAPYS